MDDIHDIDLDIAYTRIAAAEEAALAAAGDGTRRHVRETGGVLLPGKAGEPQATVEDVRAALAVIPNPDLHWSEWCRLGMAVWNSTGGSPEGLTAFHDWSRKSKKYDADDTDAKWANYDASPPNTIGFGTLFYEARQIDPNFRKPSDIALDPPPADAPEGRGQQPDLFGRDIATDSSTSEAGEDTRTPASVKLGDLVQWTSGGQDQLPAPLRIEWVSEDGAYARVTGSMTGIPTDQFVIVDPSTHSSTPKNTEPDPADPKKPEPRQPNGHDHMAEAGSADPLVSSVMADGHGFRGGLKRFGEQPGEF